MQKLNGFNNGRDTTDGVGGKSWDCELKEIIMSEKENLKLSSKKVCNIVFGDDEEWDEIESSVEGTWRHGTEHTGVFQRISDKKFFRINWRNSPKDSMGFEDMNFSPIEAEEVFAKTKTVVYYE
jgi:hypothetical protein